MASLRFRAKASRTPYTRAGMALSATAWSSEFTLDDIGVSRMAILAGDPIVILQRRRGEETWEMVPAVARASFASASLQVVDPEPTAEGGPSWGDVEAARTETAELSRQVVAALQSRVGELEGEVSIERAAAKAAEKAATAAAAKVTGLQKQVDGLKAGLAAAKGKQPKAEKTGPVDPPAGDPAT